MSAKDDDIVRNPGRVTEISFMCFYADLCKSATLLELLDLKYRVHWLIFDFSNGSVKVKFLLTTKQSATVQVSVLKQKSEITRKSSCVNARGIPPARGCKMLTLPPHRLDLTPPGWT